jgi:hypothetical protein
MELSGLGPEEHIHPINKCNDVLIMHNAFVLIDSLVSFKLKSKKPRVNFINPFEHKLGTKDVVLLHQ